MREGRGPTDAFASGEPGVLCEGGHAEAASAVGREVDSLPGVWAASPAVPMVGARAVGAA